MIRNEVETDLADQIRRSDRIELADALARLAAAVRAESERSDQVPECEDGGVR